MKWFLSLYGCLCFLPTLFGQLKLPDDRTYTYSREQVHYYFLWKSEREQSLNWDTIYGRERCEVHLINNTADTLLIQRVGSGNHPVYWYRNDNKKIHLPGDTIHLKSHLARRFGSFTRPISIDYHSSSNIKQQRLIIPTKGFFMDTVELRLNRAFREKQALEELKKSNPNRQYYENGQLRSMRNPNPEQDSIPVFTTYYEDGTIRVQEFKGDGIKKKAYDRSGKLLNVWDHQNLRTEYYPNGQVKFKEGKNRLSSTVPYLSYYYENGCIKKEVFLQETIIMTYDSLKCGKLLERNTVEVSSERMLYGKITTHYKDGQIVGRTYQNNGGSRNEAQGRYQDGQLMDGKVSYYSNQGILLFENVIQEGKRDTVLFSGEKQGKQINQYDQRGRKIGLWLTEKKTNEALVLSNDFRSTFPSAHVFATYQFEYDCGDTLAKVIFHDSGSMRYYAYIKNREERIQKGEALVLSYHENGMLATKSYQLKNGLKVYVKYSDSLSDQIIGGMKGNTGKLIYQGQRLIEIQHEPLILPVADEFLLSMGQKKKDYCLEKGSFKHFELYNGSISYFTGQGTKMRTEKVVRGVIQGNPRIYFEQKQLERAALQNDLNFNGWVEEREVKELTGIQLSLSDEELRTFNWSELNYFKKLIFIYVNNRSYRLSDYGSKEALKKAVLANEGKAIPGQRYSWEPPIPDPTDPVLTFPQVEAEFPGGMTALLHWIDSNLVCPKGHLEAIEGKVYVSFVVLKDGSISDFKILKSLHPDFDREALRLFHEMPKWTPAYDHFVPVESRVTIPIRFRLK